MMDATNETIQALLEKTGLSCDDLLQKLLAFKSRENESKNTVKETADTTTDKPTVNGNIDSCDSNSSSLTKSHSSTHSSITEENHTLCNNNNDGKKEDPTNEHHFIQEKQSPSRLDSAQSSTTRLEEVKVTTEEFEQNKTKSQESAEVPLETTAALKDKCNKSHKTNTLNQTSRETGNICREHVSYTEGHTVCKPQKLDLEENGCTEKSLGSKQKNKEETLLETTEPLKEASPVHVREQCRGNNVLDFNQRPTGSKSLNSNSNQINSKLIATTCIQKNKKGTIRPFEFISSAYRKVQIKKICTDNSVSVLKQGDTVNKPQQSKNEDLTCEFHFRQEKQSPNSLDSAQSSTSRLNEVKATSEELEQNKTKSRELVKEQLETTAALKDKCNISNETNTWKQVSEEKGNVRREHASYSADSHTVCKPQNSKLEESGCTEKILGSKQKNKEETLLERTEPLKVASPVPVREHNVLDFKQRYTGSKSLNSNSNQENLKVTGTCIQKNTKGTIRPFEFISSAYRKVQTKNICADNSVSVLKQENTVNKSQNLELQNQNDCTEKKLEVTGTLKQKSGEENITVEKISSAYRNDVQKLSRAHTVSTPKHEHTDNKTENSELENQNECTKESLSTADTSIPNTMSLVSKQDDSFTKIQNLGLKKQTDNTKENTNNSEKKSNKEVNKSQNLVLGNANGHAEQNLGIQSLQSSINVESNKDLKDNNHTQSKYQISPISKKRKSISDELINRLIPKLDKDENKLNIKETEVNIENTSSTSNIIITKSVDVQKENDIEVCQIDDIESMYSENKPRLKLRTDLFDNSRKHQFLSSEDENEDKVNSSEMREFLKNIVEITDLKDGSSPSEIDKPSKNSYIKDITSKKMSPKIRKVKIGFLKKKILHKAIKRMNLVNSQFEIVRSDITSEKDHEHEDIIPSLCTQSESSVEPEIDNMEAQEEVRKNLKLQLSSLRNRKKTDCLIETVCKKVSSIGDLKINYKKQLLDKEKLPNVSLPSDTAQFKNSMIVQEISTSDNTQTSSKKENSLFSLSKETNFMIVDVQGGVTFQDDDKSAKDLEQEKDIQSDTIKLTKTNDITKIKGWKNKKFDLDQKNEVSADNVSSNSVMEKSKPSTIEENNTSSEKILPVEENSNEELSPFVSNTLEEFLTENSTLNISYKIPKLGAEESFKEKKYKHVVLPKTSDPPALAESEKKDKPKGLKAKTLAEKRRMLEGKMPKKRPIFKEENKVSKTSYVSFNGQILYIPSTSTNTCLAEIKSKPKRFSDQNYRKTETDEFDTPRKLSLLNLWKKQRKSVTYKPGPLSKKQELQNVESLLEWDTMVQELPQVQLKVIPEIGKPISPHLVHLLPKFGPVVGNDHIEFALSTMYNKFGKQTKKGFVLPVPYANNQKSILVRKRRRENNINLLYDIKPEKNSVASVINDLLNYVENKANEDSIILDAEPYKEDELIANQTTSPINESTITDDNLALKNSKRRRLNAELHRLNCKVVSVTVDEAETTSPDCKKPYCKFGCVCRSLECIPRLPLHCSNISCMFDCECSTNEEASQTEEISLLSSDTVTRIEDQAKKYLAKEEKEFTQTIIHANDNTILIPSSGRSKTKRVKRLPKRFSDYLEDFNLDQPIISANESTKRLQHIENYNCFIELEKLDLQTVVPLCLDHNCYNCSCLVVSNTQSKKNVIDQESKFEEKVPPIKIKRRRISMIEKDYKSLENLQSSGETANSDLFENIIVQEERKKKRKEGCARVCGVYPEFVAGNGEKANSDLFENSTVQEEKKKKRKDGCARVCGVHPEFVARNEIPFYKKKLKVRLRNMENLCSIDVSSLPNVNYTEPHTDLIDVTTPLTIRGSDRLKLILTDNSRHKRKQVLKVRDDVDSVIFQQRKIIKKFKRKSLEETEEINERQAEHMPYKSIFDGEIVIPTNENKEFVKKLGVKSVAPYMRLLPWNDLLRNYYNSKIKIWCSQEKNDKLIINTSDKVAPEGYIEIAKSHRKNGIMTWILNKELPKQTPGELVHLILSPNNEHFEISGICLKNIPISTDNKKNLNNSNEEFKNSKMIDQEPKKQTVEVVNESHSNFLEHKNVNNELNVLCMTQQVYQPQYYYLEPSCEKMCDENFPLSVELPIIRPHLRWRMLFLNSNFSFLSFINNKYSIKYTDLMHILKKAQNHNKTISLQSMQLSSGYSQKNYGIYAVPKFRDRLFIGPYKLDEDHGLETLRYLRQSLVSTSTFEMAQGGSNPNNKKAVWLVTKVGKVRDKECSSLNSNLLVPDIVMDTSCSAKNPINITEHSEKVEKAKSQYAELIPISTKSVDECLDTKNSENETHDLQKITDHSNLFESCKTFISSMDLEEKASVNFPQFILFNGKKMKPQDYNRFIMTNIPHFGYLGAIQDEQSKTIDVDWPFARKVLRFPNVTAATEFLKRRFANLLLPVPVSFQIQLILLREIDFINNSPVDANILSGTHICGEFGVMDSRKLTPSLAETLGTTQEEVLKRLAKRAQYLGGLEIRKLQKQEKMLVEMKKDLIIQKQKNLAKYMELLMILPEQKRLESYNKFRHQFNGRSLSSMTEKGESKDVKMEDIECIEITDSDSDLETSSLLTEPTQITKAVQTTVSPKKSLVMKSVLKSNISPQPQPSQSDRASTKSVESLKFLKTSTGKLILLRDTCVVPSPPVTTMRRIITNNRVIGTEKTNCDSLLKIIKNPTELNTKNVNPESDEND